MLTELRIKNFAIIDALTLELERGFNVLSGETGAGKSIIVEALGLLLGERATADVIRAGADRASVEGTFDIRDRQDVGKRLDERGIETDEGTVVLKREVTPGRARAWINNSPVSAAVLAETGRLLVNLHGQHEAQTLLDPAAQRSILDVFAGAAEQVARVAAAHESFVGLEREIADLTRRRAEAERRADYLRHVAREIEDAKLVEGEDARLEDEARRLEHADELRSLAQAMVSALEGDDEALLSRLGALSRPLASLQRIDPALAKLQESHDAAYFALEALSRDLNAYLALIEIDPDRLEVVRRRRDLLFRLTKKYGPTLADAIRTGRDAKAELDLLDGGSLDLTQLESRRAAARQVLEREARALTDRRQTAGKKLEKAVDAVLPELGMSDGHLTVALRPLAEVARTGAEDVEFCVSLNLGHDARPLARVASGGELSRVMLALKTILARLDEVPTLVFDEVDAGIGGRIGLQVGDTLRRVAEHHQVFAITHLPQIAARAHHHIVVSKGARGGVTTADVTVVADQSRVAEIARMLGGDPESSTSQAHARELLDASAAPARRKAAAAR